MGHSCRTLLWDTPVGHTLRTRLPPKVTLRGCKTSVSYETSSKSHASSLKNKRFARDFLQKSNRSTHITQPCQAISRFQPLQMTPAHTPIPMRQRHSPLPQLTASRFPAPATNLSASTRLTRTKYCACHEMSPPSHIATSRFPAPATKIQLPHLKTCTSPAPATKSNNVISCELQQNLHHTTRLE